MRPALCEDALRLGRILAELAPGEPEVHGLVALMEIQASRSRARVGPNGEPVLLLDQDRARWDFVLIRRGLAALARAESRRRRARARTRCRRRSRPATRARSAADDTDWQRIAALYEHARATHALAGDRAQSRGRGLHGARAGGRARDRRRAARRSRRCEAYHLLPSVRGDLLAKLGRASEARAELERAASLTRNARERELLLARAAALPGIVSRSPHWTQRGPRSNISSTSNRAPPMRIRVLAMTLALAASPSLATAQSPVSMPFASAPRPPPSD